MSTFKDAAAKRKSTTTKAKTSISKTSTRKTKEEDSIEREKKLNEGDQKELKKKKVLGKNAPSRQSALEKSKENASAASKKIQAKSETPSSNRVQKTQYFPSKNLYSNALKSMEKTGKNFSVSDKKKSPSLVKKPTSTVSLKTTNNRKPKEGPISSKSSIKSITKTRDSSPETTSSSLGRPRTATLRKGSIVNANIVGPDAGTPQSLSMNESVNNPEETYEEDFESYESDFEAATSSSDETNSGLLISGASGSMSTSSENIEGQPGITSIAKRLSSAESDERKLDSGTFELTDFKHRQILKYIEDTVKKEDPIMELQQEKCAHHSLSDEGFEDQKSLQFINFADAKKKCEKRRASAARKKRGEELLSMIKLDAMNFTIFDSPSVPYEDYIINYGRGCAVQASVQTGEDNISEEVQTENVEVREMWTQMPARFSNFNLNVKGFWNQYKYELKGVGESKSVEDLQLDTNEGHLESFLKHSANLVMEILSEERFKQLETFHQNKTELPFSRGYLELNTSGGLLKDTTLQTMSVHPRNIGKILTVHSNNNINFDPVKSLVCIWNLSNLDTPSKTLVSFGEVSCATFCLDGDNSIIAGQNDGALAVWNTEKKHGAHDIINRTPSFITPIGTSHLWRVMTVCQKGSDREVEEILPRNEVLSMDDSGKIIIWTLYSRTKDVVLLNSQIINLTQVYPHLSEFVCTDCLVVDHHIYVSTSNGFILHCLDSGKPGSTKMFHSESKSEAICLENCPFSSSHFLAGYANGDIILFSKTTDQPLLVLQNKDQIDISKVQIIHWSKTKPFLFYAKDSTDTIHVWDLSKSDMCSQYSVHFPEKISCLKLSPALNVEDKHGEISYMLIGTASGKISLHLLHKEHGRESIEKYEEDVKVFLSYVSRL
ncbi:cytoplasmic dynein 2 intermediate chain 1 [Euwallacea similis]|uniref:cytoplasmic dynein 2 intermediate chain 1 n=1 Tax=Euwallacea similis TaxID=1736056 RepID=UPI00344D6482